MANRKVEEIRNEYNQVAWKAGNISYQIQTLEKDLKMVYETMTNLNFEAAASQKAEEEAATATAAHNAANTGGASDANVEVSQ